MGDVTRTRMSAPDIGPKVKLRFAWYDMWVGVFYDRKRRIVYVCPLPMLLIEWRRDAR